MTLRPVGRTAPTDTPWTRTPSAPLGLDASPRRAAIDVDRQRCTYQ